MPSDLGHDHSQKRIRFKFMPTPSGTLHVGHAWLLILMDTLAARAREDGHEADVVLVWDELTYRHDDPTQRNAISEEIIQNAAWLGISFARVISNLSYPYELPQTHPMQSVSCNRVAPPVLSSSSVSTINSGSSYFLKNCILDAALQVTHVIRGEDQLARASVYATLYELLEIPSPRLVYLPFVRTPEGSKVTARGCYTLTSLKQAVTAEELYGIIVSSCLKNTSVQRDFVRMPMPEARKLLLGDDWDWILGRPDGQAKLSSFLARIEPAPRIDLQALLRSPSMQ